MAPWSCGERLPVGSGPQVRGSLRGRRSTCCCCCAHGRPCPDSRLCRSVSDSGIRVFECGEEEIPCSEFPVTVRTVCDESQQVVGQQGDE